METFRTIQANERQLGSKPELKKCYIIKAFTCFKVQSADFRSNKPLKRMSYTLNIIISPLPNPWKLRLRRIKLTSVT